MLRAAFPSLRHAACVRVRPREPRFVARAMSGGSALHNGTKFGPIHIPGSQIFVETSLSVGLVNLKPVVPGHVLVVSKRVCLRFDDLTWEETVDLWSLAKRVGHLLEQHVGASSLTFALQDGPQAGQTVPHVHVHVLPRTEGDFTNNDDVYHEIDASAETDGERRDGGGDRAGDDTETKSKRTRGGSKPRRFDPDAERVARTNAAMAAEAAELRLLFPE